MITDWYLLFIWLFIIGIVVFTAFTWQSAATNDPREGLKIALILLSFMVLWTGSCFVSGSISALVSFNPSGAFLLPIIVFLLAVILFILMRYLRKRYNKTILIAEGYIVKIIQFKGKYLDIIHTFLIILGILIPIIFPLMYFMVYNQIKTSILQGVIISKENNTYKLEIADIIWQITTEDILKTGEKYIISEVNQEEKTLKIQKQ